MQAVSGRQNKREIATYMHILRTILLIGSLFVVYCNRSRETAAPCLVYGVGLMSWPVWFTQGFWQVFGRVEQIRQRSRS